MIDKYSAPSAEHILGTDSIGRDVFARLLYGGRISLSVGLISCLISVAIGILAGCLACFGGRLADSLIMRTVDVVICFPVMFLIITISCFITPTIYTIMLIIGLVSWTGTARLVRGEILKSASWSMCSPASCWVRATFASSSRMCCPTSSRPWSFRPRCPLPARF